LNLCVSIIIPVKALNDYIHEALPHLLSLDYSNFEILIFPDELPDYKLPKIFSDTRIRIIASGKTGPAEKRDMALKYAQGDIFAFIDDDAYPRFDWLKNAVKYFDDKTVGAVGGPAVTPDSDSLLQKASGRVFESYLCSGAYIRRYKPQKQTLDDDLPSVNLLVRRDVFEKIGGFDSSFYPGEDTKLCLDITKKLGKKIIYCPEVFVYHHRRKLFRGHLKQIANYAKHRGYFMKRLSATSLRIPYLLPLCFMLGVFLGPIACMLFPVLWPVYFSVLGLYFFADIISVFKLKTPLISLLAFFGVFATHITYGFFTLVGLFSKDLPR